MLAHRRRPSQPDPRRSGERGETLIELLITILIMGGIVSAILGALFTVASVADLNRERTTTSITVQTYAERLKQPDQDGMAYQPCATASSYQAPIDALAALPPGYTVTVDSVENYVAPNFTTNTAQCTALAAYTTISPAWGFRRDGGVQRITLTVKSPTSVRHPTKETLVVVKRDARCPTSALGYSNPDEGPC